MLLPESRAAPPPLPVAHPPLSSPNPIQAMEENDGRAATSKTLFGRYEMGRLLGQGTFAKVYHGKHLQTGDSVAIKVLNKDQIRREGLVQQIIREISVMRLVRHPNVVELREVMATKSRIFFAMEYVRGGELFAKVSHGKLKEDDARRYFQQLVSAVDFCHSRGVSHRDLKPENLLLDEKGNLKISDFGLSALPEQLRNDGLLHTQCGTPAYVAPEVLRKKGYDGAKADLWSCGVILYVLLAGFLPFQDENLMRMYQKVFKAEFQCPPWVSAGAKRLISRLLVAKPENRITIPEIMRDPWFRKGLAACHEDEGEEMAIAVPPSEEETKGESPPFYNAFELISAMSSGFDLSGMFESRGKAGTVFTSRRTAAEVVDGVRRAGRELGFVVNRSRGYKLRLEGKVDGRNGRLVVTVEVFEAAEGVTVAEFCRTAGDVFEYAAFCDEVRPGLREVVWTWQGGDRGS